ncbi:hypothetical protein TNCV_4720331 [Trichonephila clavipes]|uniref:Uncharacterized protein n=1 Tax=Trichonephila clavipes TaxID=2585209 RepID=A0A8X6W6H7_TRICX|nr:hypothetical protein TNCV_4720331 [Trichonephila clavipes]
MRLVPTVINRPYQTSHCSATGGLFTSDFVILNHGQVTRTTPELAPQPRPTTTPPHWNYSSSAFLSSHGFWQRSSCSPLPISSISSTTLDRIMKANENPDLLQQN